MDEKLRNDELTWAKEDPPRADELEGRLHKFARAGNLENKIKTIGTVQLLELFRMWGKVNPRSSQFTISPSLFFIDGEFDPVRFWIWKYLNDRPGIFVFVDMKDEYFSKISEEFRQVIEDKTRLMNAQKDEPLILADINPPLPNQHSLDFHRNRMGDLFEIKPPESGNQS